MWVVAVLVLAVAVIVLLFVIGLLKERRGAPGRHSPKRPSRDSFRQDSDAPQAPRKRAAVVVNPTKTADVAHLTAQLTAVMAAHGWDTPLVLTTTPADPGPGQARQAIDAGVDLVCVLGGDGTVRQVAEVLAGGSVPLGLLPGGTGNLLARNLQVPKDSLDAAVEIALTGRNLHIDVGWVVLDPDTAASDAAPDDGVAPEPDTAPDPPQRHAFLVMAGLGFDAATMDDTPDELKARVGWPAYISGGLRNLLGRRFHTILTVDDGPPQHFRTRTVVAGNCGRLTGGITLMPDAAVDDGLLDLVVISPKGLAGWAAVAAHVLAQRASKHARLDRFRASTAHVTVDEPQAVQADGDVLGEAGSILLEIVPRSLIVRVSSIP